MQTTRRHLIAIAIATATGWVAPGLAQAADSPIVIGYQTGVDPSKVAQADGLYEKAIGKPLQWKKFESGAEVIAALASGSVQIADLGSSPLAAATTRQRPIKTFLIVAEIGSSEALVARNGSGIKTPQDLVGKKVAVPFVSTTHYSLLAALKHWKIDPAKVNIVNLRPSEITAAWQRGDIDAAYVWDPALSKAKESGKTLVTSTEVGKWGAPTFEAWVVNKDFAAKNPDVVAKFSQVTLQTFADYRKNPSAWNAQSSQVAKIARLTGADPKEIPGLLAGSRFPVGQEQLSSSLLGGGTAKALQNTAEFLKEQKKVDSVLPSYSGFVEASFVRQAAGK
ncbi:taurine ABC transporter substrate-binding protein [Crenobacter sp. SG2305]|uniref:taurine ABC transporter substrate-binding protein n=1 Tax=Crenobacter oryzisoli TaxID=3056844 RepID=UPI0025AADCEB|nr:taurine ABC transporter substrate-binding protein [Crenobacter sp. SG2305]MDN0083570.1 taurine ABC transporter substrate-binding protein [Crenobacter sp. SG2305]